MYQLLKKDLEEAIRTGRLKPGQKVPSESDLIAAYHVSATTARRCLDELELEGLLQRRQGKGTFVSEMAQLLNRQRVAIVIKDLFSLAHPFLANLVGTIEYELESKGVHVVISRARSSGAARDTGVALQDLMSHEGVEYALILSNMPLKLVQTLVENGINCLGVNTRYLDDRIPCVSMDFAASFLVCGTALAERGHRKIVFLTQEPPMKDQGVLNSASLIEAAHARLRERFPGLPEDPLIVQIPASGTMADGIEQVLAQKPSPTAIMCWDELAALEVMRILSDRGIRVPRDISVVGSRLLPSSPVSCVKTPLDELAKKAAEKILGWMNGLKPVNELLQPTGFLERDTIASVDADGL